MNAKSRFLVWGPFVAAALLSWLIGETASSIRPYYELLYFLGALNAILAVRVLRHTGLRPLPILGIVVGLAIGQWRIIEAAAMTLFWSFRGFAP